MYNVLIVDDNQKVLQTISTAFNDSGVFNVVVAASDLEARRKTHNQIFDLVCTEFIVNRATNVDFVTYLKSDRRYKNVPIIVCTKEPEQLPKRFSEKDRIIVIGKDITTDMLIQIANAMLATFPEISSKVEKQKQIDVRIINHFINATTVAINTMTSAENIKSRAPFVLKKDSVLLIDISGIIRILSTAFDGELKVSFPKATFLKLISSMFGEEYLEINTDIQDAAGELTNVILGQAKQSISREGIDFEKTIPLVKLEKGVSEWTPNKPTIVVPFDCDLGEFFIQISVR